METRFEEVPTAYGVALDQGGNCWFAEFTKDGKLILSGKAGDQEFKREGTYKLKGDKFDISFKMGDDEHTDEIIIKKLDETTLSTTNKEGKAVELTRKK